MADRILPTDPIYDAYLLTGRPLGEQLDANIQKNRIQYSGTGPENSLAFSYPPGVTSATGFAYRPYAQVEQQQEPTAGTVKESDLLLAMNRLLGTAPARGTVPVGEAPLSIWETAKYFVGIKPPGMVNNPNIVPVVPSEEASRQAAYLYQMAGGDKAPKNEVMERMLRFFTEAYGAPNSAQ